MLEPALNALAVAERADGIFVDATFGRGGHSGAILSCLDAAGLLLALDQDPSAAAVAQSLVATEPRFHFQRINFRHLEQALASAPSDRPNGILFDLGVSSPQLDDPERGFSFRHDGPLDMRMASSADAENPSAACWLAEVSEEQLAKTLRDYGEERFAKRIARTLVAARQQRPITRTLQLAELISAAVPRPRPSKARREPLKHPATRSFQAIRIAVNDELGALQQALQQAVAALAPGGRLVVISFHSLEDRIVKRFMRDQARGQTLPERLPVTAVQAQAAAGARLRLLGKAQPDAAELARNPRARSAVLRVAERLA